MTAYERALRPGTLIHNRYRVERVLGAGGFGITYLVTDLRDQCIAAMKEYMPMDTAVRNMATKTVYPKSQKDAESYERFKKKFLNEAQTLYRFREHPNITEVRKLFTENNTAYFIMEYVDGMDLRKYLKEKGGTMPWEELAPILEQVCGALKTVHQGGIIHCDISPDNIYLLKNGQVKLLDFGAAKETLRCDRVSSVMVGKPGFFPPEQMTGRRMGTWSDIYALGATILVCLTGRVPPPSEMRLTGEAVKWPSELGIQLPEGVEPVLEKMLALLIQERYQNMDELCGDLFACPGFQKPENSTDNSDKTHVETVPVNAPVFSGTPVIPRWSDSGPIRMPPQPRRKTAVLEGLQGVYIGARIAVRGDMRLGTDRNRCEIVYPPRSPGVSGLHLQFWDAGKETCRLMVMDMGSTYGTWLNKRKMTPRVAYPMPPGAILYLGDGQVFRSAESD